MSSTYRSAIWMTLLIADVAWARPDSGSGMYTFDSSDVLATVDGPTGQVRVTYSVSGPNQTRQDDDDGNGILDFPEQVAVSAEAVLAMYAELGFRSPLSEADMGLSELGGSPAFDFYLVDFAGNADGMFGIDACSGQVCSGYMVMENDFYYYGYPSVEEAIGVLTSHELFHAVQAAYRYDQEVWISEGTAVWGEYQFDPESDDFIGFSNAYLEDVTRSLDEPPSGPVPTFAYATALWWQFLTERYGIETIVAVQEAQDSGEGLDAMVAALEDEGIDLSDEWTRFARWNLATGERAGLAESYPFAAELAGIDEPEAEGASIQDDNRFYPLATTYYRIDHPGGELLFQSIEDPTGVVFDLMPVADGADDGPVEEPVVRLVPTDNTVASFGELPAGGYWLVGSYPQPAEESTKFEFCVGLDVSACEVVDTGSLDTGGAPEPKPGGCGCWSLSGEAQGAAGWWLAVVGLVVARRRKNMSIYL